LVLAGKEEEKRKKTEGRQLQKLELNISGTWTVPLGDGQGEEGTLALRASLSIPIIRQSEPKREKDEKGKEGGGGRIVR